MKVCIEINLPATTEQYPYRSSHQQVDPSYSADILNSNPRPDWRYQSYSDKVLLFLGPPFSVSEEVLDERPGRRL